MRPMTAFQTAFSARRAGAFIRAFHRRLRADCRGALDLRTILILLLLMSFGGFGLQSLIGSPPGGSPPPPSQSGGDQNGEAAQSGGATSSGGGSRPGGAAQSESELGSGGLGGLFSQNGIATPMVPSQSPADEEEAATDEDPAPPTPSVSEAIINMACDVSDAVSSAQPGAQPSCNRPQPGQEQGAAQQQAQAASEQGPAPEAEAEQQPQSQQQAEPQQQQAQQQPATNGRVDAARAHTTVTGAFPETGSYGNSVEIDGWTASCPADGAVVGTEVMDANPDATTEKDRFRAARGGRGSGVDREGSTVTFVTVKLYSDVMKEKTTAAKLFHFYNQCAFAAQGIVNNDQKACWIGEKGHQEGWLTEDGSRVLCRSLSIQGCKALHRCSSGKSGPVGTRWTDVRPDPDSAYARRTNEFPAVGTYPPGRFEIDGFPAQCGDVTVEVSARGGPGWGALARIDDNVIQFGRAELIGLSTAKKLTVFAHECSHMHDKTDEHEADCGAWAVRRQNGWATQADVDYECRRARTNFVADYHDFTFASPEEHCGWMQACFSGERKPRRNSLYTGP